MCLFSALACFLLPFMVIGWYRTGAAVDTWEGGTRRQRSCGLRGDPAVVKGHKLHPGNEPLSLAHVMHDLDHYIPTGYDSRCQASKLSLALPFACPQCSQHPKARKNAFGWPQSLAGGEMRDSQIPVISSSSRYPKRAGLGMHIQGRKAGILEAWWNGGKRSRCCPCRA